jgi:hypothetical protein
VSDNLTEGPAEHTAFVDIPLEVAQQFRDLLAAARAWRGGLIPNTSTATLTPTRGLLEALSVFDRPACDHPRPWRVYKGTAYDADEYCGYCGTVLVPGITARVPSVVDIISPALADPETSSPPESSSSAP